MSKPTTFRLYWLSSDKPPTRRNMDEFPTLEAAKKAKHLAWRALYSECCSPDERRRVTLGTMHVEESQ
jgi:hypothetical protein